MVPKHRRNKRKDKRNKSKMAWTHSSTKSFTAPPGTYYIGDLIGVLKEEAEEKLSEKSYAEGLYKKTEEALFFMGLAANGAMAYRGSGSRYETDSGSLGICSEELVDKKSIEINRGKTHVFTEPVLCSLTDGVFLFKSGKKSVKIDTLDI